MNLTHRNREPRGARRRARIAQQSSLVAVLTACPRDRVALPTPVRGFAPAREWLVAQPAYVRDAARAWLHELADVRPDLLTTRTHRNEIGASVVVRAAAHCDRALASPASFTGTAHTRAGIAQLLRHMFARYAAPTWLVSSMMLPGTSLARRTSADPTPPAFLPHVAQGGSFRTAGLPIHVTHAIAHELATTSTHAPRLAVRLAQTTAANVPFALRDAIASALAQRPFGTAEEEACIDRFLAFLARFPNDVDRGELAVLLAWFVDAVVRDPAFDFAHRTRQSLGALATRELRMGIKSARKFRLFQPSGIAGARLVTVDGWWTVSELDSGAALALEALRRRHCVAGYANAILAGTIAVFALEHEEDSSRGVTVEVRLKTKAVAQVRGFANRGPTADESEVLRAWAAQRGLTM
jgi:hypothetical protein